MWKYSNWRKRTRDVAEYITTRSEAYVYDFGCGDRYLGTLLPSEKHYVGYDIIQQPHATQWDFSQGVFPRVKRESIIVMLGLLEYLPNPLWLLLTACQRVTCVVVSFLYPCSKIAEFPCLNDLTIEEIEKSLIKKEYLFTKTLSSCRNNSKALFFIETRR